MAIRDTGSLEHPLQRFFTATRPQPTFQWERHQQRDVLVITHPQCQAVFSRQGAQLLHFQPTGQKPWLWCASQWPQVGAIRGGVPVCWPWVGRHPGEGGWPANGWGRLLDWKLIDSQEHADGVSLHWRLSLWDWQADLYAELGQGMDLRLETRHEDSEPCQFGQALHAYWRISDIGDVAGQPAHGCLFESREHVGLHGAREQHHLAGLSIIIAVIKQRPEIVPAVVIRVAFLPRADPVAHQRRVSAVENMGR